MSNFIDYKVTVWKRINLHDNSKTEEIIELLNKGCDIDRLYDDGLLRDSSFTIEGTEAPVSVEENGGCETIEVFSANGENIWDNSQVEYS